LKNRLNFYDEEITRSKKILSNSNFISKAPKELIDKEKEKIFYYEEQKEKIVKKIGEKEKN
jgi:valyl-tRNA synthetase